MTQKDALRSGNEVSSMKAMMAGGMSGIVARFFTAPLDVLKISAQLKPRNKIISVHENNTSMGISSFQISTDHTFKGEKPKKNMSFLKYGRNGSDVISITKEIFERDGIKGFFKGNVPGMTMYLIYGSVQFSTYSFLNKTIRLFENNNAAPKYYESLNSLINGALAGISACIVTYPLDVLKTRFVAIPSQNRESIIKEIVQIYKYENGIRGFYKGCGASVGTFGLSTALIFSIYETLTIFIEKNKEFSFATPFVSGITGVLSKTLTFPLDTIRRRIQIMQAKNLERITTESDVYKAYNMKKRFFSIGKQIVKTEGILALYQGLTVGLIKSAPTTAISLSVYQYVVNL
ncbi:related to Mitochondrial thiamine pyrophosphate carrier 1 [Hanseniaspora guilliermondii]|uniref:Related to Mitochondrial thiamine pyrophosphate carrier 1 n=1 Tax=Hanseniaspora guilliermondii TaxID=56406 RepID=A0A1L0B0T4_9ASCO|nr:related to Mitochondrial thiamine pyrophosphate carrier 1 [Hanseniaspora guilliermondii]